MNSFKDVTEEPFKSFIVVAVYLNRDSVAERYLVYQEERDSPRVWVTKRLYCAYLQLFFCRSDIPRIASTSQLPLAHSSSFLNSITSHLPYLLIPISQMPLVASHD